jgi:hypothetical protein
VSYFFVGFVVVVLNIKVWPSLILAPHMVEISLECTVFQLVLGFTHINFSESIQTFELTKVWLYKAAFVVDRIKIEQSPIGE